MEYEFIASSRVVYKFVFHGITRKFFDIFIIEYLSHKGELTFTLIPLDETIRVINYNGIFLSAKALAIEKRLLDRSPNLTSIK